MFIVWPQSGGRGTAEMFEPTKMTAFAIDAEDSIFNLRDTLIALRALLADHGRAPTPEQSAAFRFADNALDDARALAEAFDAATEEAA